MHILSRDSALPVVKRQSNAPPFQVPKFNDNNGISMGSPALQEFQGYIPTRKSMSAQTKETTPRDKVFETNDKSLEHIEQQLYDYSLARRAGNSQIRMIHGSYLGIGIILSGTLLYFCHAKILAGLATFGICACRKRSTRQIPDAENPTTINEGHQQQNEATLSMSNSAHNVVPVTTPRANPNQTPTSMSNSARNQTTATSPRIQLPIQTLHPA